MFLFLFLSLFLFVVLVLFLFVATCFSTSHSRPLTSRLSPLASRLSSRLLLQHPIEHLYYFSCLAPTIYFRCSPFITMWNGMHLMCGNL